MALGLDTASAADKSAHPTAASIPLQRSIEGLLCNKKKTIKAFMRKKKHTRFSCKIVVNVAFNQDKEQILLFFFCFLLGTTQFIDREWTW